MDAGKWYQIGTPFVALEEGQEVTINDIFANGFSDGDQAYLYNSTTSSYGAPLTWGQRAGEPEGWRTGRGVLDTTVLTPGQVLFIHKTTSSEVCLSGRVSATETVSFGSEEGATWAQIVCVYPTSQTLNEMTWSNMTAGDQAYIYDSASSSYGSPLTWGSRTGEADGWRTGRGTLDQTKLSPGQAIFVYKKSAGIATCAPTAE